MIINLIFFLLISYLNIASSFTTIQTTNKQDIGNNDFILSKSAQTHEKLKKLRPIDPAYLTMYQVCCLV